MKKILLIGNDELLMENTSTLLRSAGYVISEAGDGETGLEKARAEHPDLIISDLTLPKIGGFDILHVLQKDPSFIDVPFIFLTREGSYTDFRRGMNIGADDFFAGPFNGAEILNSVENKLARIDRIKERLSRVSADETIQTYTEGEHTLQTFFTHQVVNKYKRKQLIFQEGNYPHYLYYVQKGKVKGYKRNDEGKELTVVLYGEGDFIGFTALFESGTYHVTTEALENCEIVLIPKEDFFKRIKSHPGIAMEFIRMLAKNNNQKAEQMVQLAYNSLRKRTAGALLLLQEKFKPVSVEKFIIRITREELAHLSGTTTESLIRTLSDFKAEHLISITSGDITILDEDGLKNILN